MTLRLLASLAFLGLLIGLQSAATAGGPIDTDGDTIPDDLDNCPTISNPIQEDGDLDMIGDVCDNCSDVASFVPGVNFCDIDSDGYGGPCDCDMDQPGDFICQISDYGIFSLNFGMAATPLRPTDLNCNGVTQLSDFGLFAVGFGGPPGPSGLDCAGDPICTPSLPPVAAAGGPVDSDGDNIPDALDNCPTVPNTSQADGDSDTIGDVCDNCSTIASSGPPTYGTPFGQNFCDIDSDGYGGPCDGDFSNDFIVQIADYGTMGANWGMPATLARPTDLDCDGITQITDIGIYQAGFGQAPGPSGLACAGSPPCTP